MSRARVSRWAGRTVLAGLCWLPVATVAILLSAPSATVITLALPGAALTVLFGKGFSLVPSYFARSLSIGWAPAATLALAVPAVALLAAEPFAGVPAVVGSIGAVLWLVALLVWAGTLAWTVRGNLTGAETGTVEANADRERLDRLSNAGIPIAVLYLLVGALALVGVNLGLGWPAAGRAGVAHLLGAGGATLAILTIGFRVYPRFLVSKPPRVLPPIVIPAGVLGPAFLVLGLGGIPWSLHAGAILEAVAVGGFALAYAITFWRSDRRRIGLYGPLLGVGLASGAVVLALLFVFEATRRPVIAAHRRLMLLGFLGTTVGGTAFQFYPPAVGGLGLSRDETASAALVAFAGGIGVNAIAMVFELELLATAGMGIATIGAALIPLLVAAVFRERAA